MTLPLKRIAGRSERGRPYREFENLCAGSDGLAQWVFGGRAGESAWSPTADIAETDNAYILEVELPGVHREDVDIALNGNEFVVTGAVKERKREGLFRRRTRRVGEFEFRVTLPGDLRADDIEASLAYGVLKVHVPKAQGAKANEITVNDKGDGKR
jgi:HSP20 family protein